jgi:hypothetical protein
MATLGVCLAASPAVAAADPPVFSPAVRLDPRPKTEPRVVVAPNDHRFVVTNDAQGAVVFRSTDAGATWTPTASRIPGQHSASIDTDIIAMPDGRILASELDSAGLNFPSAVSDDEGATWIASLGSNTLIDQDRQYFAAGPAPAAGEGQRVYMTFHNLFSGLAQHNVYVSTSTDGGGTFGVPVPVTLPGDQAYTDLQCGDGYQSGIDVDRRTGRIYVFFITRTAAVGGGCAASPTQVNIIGATRIWVATSPDGSPGSWRTSLAVDDSATGQVVSLQLADGRVDRQGGVWIAYPESPRAYPDSDGAAIKLVHADPHLQQWSAPITLAPAGGPGAILTNTAVGDGGHVAVAYERGEAQPTGPPAWYTHVVETQDALSAQPTVTDTRLSPVAAYVGTASALQGACAAAGPTQGLQNGLACSRAPDLFGVALDRDCRLTVTWPAANNSVTPNRGGTYVSTQTGGPGLCETPSVTP